MVTVFVAGEGDRSHARRDCERLTAGQNAARSQGWTEHPVEEVSVEEAQRRGKSPCPHCS